jgi:hypothetical protein
MRMSKRTNRTTLVPMYGKKNPARAVVQKTGEASVAYSWPLGGGNKVELGFANEPTQAQLDVMLAQLQIMRNVAPVKAIESEPEGKED